MWGDGMPSINIDLDAFDHPKFRLLTDILGPGAEIIPVRIWLHCGKYHTEDGRLTRYTTKVLEAIGGWRGAHGKAVKALAEVGLLDAIEGGFQVHDWKEHAGHLWAYKVRGKKAIEKRWADLKAKEGASVPPKEDHTTSIQDEYILPCNVSEISLEENISDKENAQKMRADFDKSPMRLAQEWNHRHRGTAMREKDVHVLMPFFEAWLEAGGVYDEILAEIKRRERDKTEATWDMKKRLAAAGAQVGKKASEDEIRQKRRAAIAEGDAKREAMQAKRGRPT